ncbi:MAG: efflux RND transporter periplasmic adaptor subunit, partial [Thermoanaerobaculia bacterium]
SRFEEYKKNLDLAISNYERAKEILSLALEGPRKEEILAQEKRINQIETKIKLIEEKIEDTILYSPIDGIVLSKNAEVGERANPNFPVYTIGEIDKPYVKVYVKEDKLGLVKIGQKAEIFCDTYPDKIYGGKVSYISSKAEFTPKNIQTKEERTKLVFEVKIDVKNERDELKPGMPVDVKIKIK